MSWDRHEPRLVKEALTGLELNDNCDDGAVTIAEPCHHCEDGTRLRQCCDLRRGDLKKLNDHPLTRTDWDYPGSHQGYAVYECDCCGQLWGQRYQWDDGTGSDIVGGRLDAESPVRQY